MAAKFVAPPIQDNPTGWGPCDVPEQFKDMPYQPFSKGDRLGKVSAGLRVATVLFAVFTIGLDFRCLSLEVYVF